MQETYQRHGDKAPGILDFGTDCSDSAALHPGRESLCQWDDSVCAPHRKSVFKVADWALAEHHSLVTELSELNMSAPQEGLCNRGWVIRADHVSSSRRTVQQGVSYQSWLCQLLKKDCATGGELSELIMSAPQEGLCNRGWVIRADHVSSSRSTVQQGVSYQSWSCQLLKKYCATGGYCLKSNLPLSLFRFILPVLNVRKFAVWWSDPSCLFRQFTCIISSPSKDLCVIVSGLVSENTLD
jgi:hypothetical protein